MVILVRTLDKNGKIEKSYPSVEVPTNEKIAQAVLQDKKLKKKICEIEDNAQKKSLLEKKGKKKDAVKLYHYVGSQLKPFIASLKLNPQDKKFIWGAINFHAKVLKLDGKVRLDRDRGHGNTWKYCIRLAGYSEDDAFELDWTQWVELFDTTLAQDDPRIIDWIICTKRKNFDKDKDGGLQEWFRILRKSVTERISKKTKIDTTYLNKKELHAELDAALEAVKPQFLSRRKDIAKKKQEKNSKKKTSKKSATKKSAKNSKKK